MYYNIYNFITVVFINWELLKYERVKVAGI